jgi:hypothetical protein
MIYEIEFAHPKDRQDGKVNVSSRDITSNLPYTEGAHLVFDHHRSEANIAERKPYIRTKCAVDHESGVRFFSKLRPRFRTMCER